MENARVLVCEDHERLRRGLCQVLKLAGHQVAGQAGSTPEAIELVESVDFDILVVDGKMPPDMAEGASGMAILEKVRELGKTATRIWFSASPASLFPVEVEADTGKDVLAVLEFIKQLPDRN